MVLKRGFSVLWWWLCSDFLRILRHLEKFEKPKRPLKTP